MKGECAGKPTRSEFEAAKATLEAWLTCNFEDRTEARAFGSNREARLFLRSELGPEEREVFGVMWLDARNRLIEFERVFAGTVDRADVYPREVLRGALRCNAAGAILGHNHPSGTPEPSVSDIHLTDRIGSLLKEVDVELLDHIVVTARASVSMAERGMVQPRGGW